jgi:hypothetical protein
VPDWTACGCGALLVRTFVRCHRLLVGHDVWYRVESQRRWVFVPWRPYAATPITTRPG